MKLAILTAGYLLPYIKDQINNISLENSDVFISVLDYKNFSYISDLYRQIEMDYEGFIVSGLAAYYALEKGISSPLKPTMILDADLENIYRGLLELLAQNRSLDFDKVLIDVLLPMDPENTAATLLKLPEPESAKSVSESFWNGRTIEELQVVENNVFNLIMEKWKQGRVDHVLSRYSTLLPRLEQEGVPCSFMYPPIYQLSGLIDSCIDMIRTADLREYMPAVIAVFKDCLPSSVNLGEDMDLDMLALQKELLEFNKDCSADYQLQKHSGGFYIFTNLKTVNRITNQLTNCSLSAFLKKNLTFPAAVAYGFAKDIGQAKLSASTALKTALLEHHVYAVNAEKTLLGPLDLASSLPAPSTLTPQLELIASRSRLSPLTVQKLRAIIDTNGSNEITIAELADKLGVKARNANRILTNLLQSKDAEIAGLRASGTKGRPTKVYRLLLSESGQK